MAALYVAEFQGMKIGGPAMQVPPIAEYVIAISGSSTKGQSFSDNTNYVRVNCDTICSISFGNDPTATTSNMRLAANQTEYYEVRKGQKIAVIQNV